MKIVNETNSDIEFLDNIEILFGYLFGMPIEAFCQKHNFILRTGKGYYTYEKGKKVFKESYHNYYYLAPDGNKEVQDYYYEKDLAAREKAQAGAEEEAKASGKVLKKNPIENDNFIKGFEQLKRWLRNKRHEGLFVYILPNSVDSGCAANEIDRFNSKCRVIRIENDDLAPLEIKSGYFAQLGLPEPSLKVYSGGKSPHFLFTFHAESENDDLPGFEWERLAELNAQLLRHSGHDGYHKTIQTLINEAKTLLIRLPGFTHQKTRRESRILEYGNIWDINELEAEVSKFPKLGDYDKTYTSGVQPFELIQSPEWKLRFLPYKSYAQEQAERAAKEAERQAKLEKGRKAREKQLAGLTPQEIQRRAESINGEEISLLRLVYPSVKAQIEHGTPDGAGRSHQAATAVAKNLIEAELLVKNSPLKAIETPEDLFQQWVNRTFSSNEGDLIKKVWHTFNKLRSDKHISPKPRQIDFFESLITKKQEVRVGEDAIAHLFHNRTITNLIEETVRGLKQKPQKTTLADLPVLYNANENGWNNAQLFLDQHKSIYITTAPTHALELIEAGIPGVVYVNQETLAMNIHLLAEMACENGYSFNFTPNAPGTDRTLAENLRSGYYSQLTRNALRKNKKDTKIKDYKPEVIVICEKGIEWSAHYYWTRAKQVITPEMLGNKKDDKALIWGFSDKKKWFSEVVEQCEELAKTRKLIAMISEMGTGKTEVIGSRVKSWGNDKILAIAHREQLTRQAAKRLNLVDYKDNKYGTSADKYEAAKQQGLAITINTLCQGTSEQGYLPDFKIEHWENCTLVIDEAESFIKYLIESSTIAENRQKAIDALMTLIHAVYKGGGRLIIADANLRAVTINLFEKWLGGEKYQPNTKAGDYNAYIILNCYNKFKEEGRTAIFADVRDGLLSEVTRRIEAQGSTHKAFFFTDVKNASGKYSFGTQSFGTLARERGYGRIIDADTRLFSDDPDHQTVEKLHELVKVCCKGIIFISPVIDSGTDWNNLGIDCVYGVYMGIMGIDNTLQQLERVRDNVPRFIWAARRSSMGMTKGDIQNLEKNFEEIRRSYDSSKVDLIKTWEETKVVQHDEIANRILSQFPQFNPDLLEWWQQSLDESFYAAQEFRINLKARMQEKGYTIDTKDFEVDQEFIDTLKIHGEAQKEIKYYEIANADLSLLDKIDKNDDTMPKATARAKDLKSVISALGIKQDSDYGVGCYKPEEILELVKRTLNKKAKVRRMMIYGFGFRCAMTNNQFDIAKVVFMAEEFRHMINSTSRSVKDTPMSVRAGIDFMLQKMQIKELGQALIKEAIDRGKVDDSDNPRPVMFFHNRMPIILKTNKVLVEHRNYVKKTFGFEVDIRPEMAARNIATFFSHIGFSVEKGRNREQGEGKAAGGNAPLNNYTIREDQLTLKVWQGWVHAYESTDEAMFSYFHNPSGDEGGDNPWKNSYGVNLEEKDKQISKEVFQRLHRQLEIPLRV